MVQSNIDNYNIRFIYGDEETKEVFFYDNDKNILPTEWKYPCKMYGYVDSCHPHSFHECKHSKLWEDVTGIVDKLQEEDNLSEDKRYIVCYYEVDENYDLFQKVDWNITKQEIINNVLAQKYFEGADYYLMEELMDAE